MRLGLPPEIDPEMRAAIVADTYRNYNDHLNRWPDPEDAAQGGRFVEWFGEGCLLKSIDGDEFIDCLGGYGIFTLGHRHPRVIAAVKAQMDRLCLHSQKLFNPCAAEAARRIIEVAPKGMDRVFFVNSGTEAVEAALKVARLHTGKPKFVATINGFHGKSLGSLSVTGRAKYRDPLGPLLEAEFVDYGDVDAMAAAIDERTAGIIVEPIQGEGGIIVPSDDYLPALREITKKKGVLLIVDEVQTGMGRTGTMFASQHVGVTPDIMCLAKGLSGGVIPVSAIVSNSELWKVFHPLPFIHTSTYGSNPLATTAAAAAVEVTVTEHLPERAAKNGAYFLEKLRVLVARYPSILKEARGRGFLIGLEARTEEHGIALAHALFAKNVIVAHTLNNPKVIRLEPPLIMGAELIDIVIERMGACLSAMSPGEPARA